MTVYRVELGHPIVVYTGDLTPELIERIRRIYDPSPVTVIHGKTVIHGGIIIRDEDMPQ